MLYGKNTFSFSQLSSTWLNQKTNVNPLCVIGITSYSGWGESEEHFDAIWQGKSQEDAVISFDFDYPSMVSNNTMEIKRFRICQPSVH